MRPDLFAGPALRDDSHRFLARLANGGSVPLPARQWMWSGAARRPRLGAVVALLLAAFAAWVWLQGDPAPLPAPSEAAARNEPPEPRERAEMITEPAPPQAATIVNEAPIAMQDTAAPAAVAAVATAAPRAARPRAAKPAPAGRGQRNEPAAESDEDVALLAAMLKHANPQKPTSGAPKER